MGSMLEHHRVPTNGVFDGLDTFRLAVPAGRFRHLRDVILSQEL